MSLQISWVFRGFLPLIEENGEEWFMKVMRYDGKTWLPLAHSYYFVNRPKAYNSLDKWVQRHVEAWEALLKHVNEDPDYHIMCRQNLMAADSQSCSTRAFLMLWVHSAKKYSAGTRAAKRKPEYCRLVFEMLEIVWKYCCGGLESRVSCCDEQFRMSKGRINLLNILSTLLSADVATGVAHFWREAAVEKDSWCPMFAEGNCTITEASQAEKIKATMTMIIIIKESFPLILVHASARGHEL